MEDLTALGNSMRFEIELHMEKTLAAQGKRTLSELHTLWWVDFVTQAEVNVGLAELYVFG